MCLQDYYLSDQAEDRAPRIDARDDWRVTGGSELDGTTVLSFSRKLDTCDPQDMAIDVSGSFTKC